MHWHGTSACSTLTFYPLNTKINLIMPKVLLADDSATMQKVVDLVLRDQGYEVVSANNGEDAVNIISTSPPDLVLAYIKLPGVDGYQICQKVKSNPATSKIPVVLLAGAFDPVDDAMKAQVGADGSIVKPFQAEDLLKVIREHIGSAPAAPPAEAAGGSNIMFEGEDSSMSFADMGDEGAAPLAAAPVEAEPVMAEAVEAEPVMAEAVEAEPVMAEAEPVMAEAAMQTEPMMETEAFVAETFSAEEYAAEPEMAEPAVEASPAQAATAYNGGATVPGVDGARIEAVVRETVELKVAEAMAAIDLKTLVMQALEPKAKEVLEKLAYEVVPEFLDRILRSNISESLTAVNRELENIIWETVPDLAEEMLKKEIKRIRQENQ